ncbi:NAD-dependent epimerase/dehydratase family protein [Candidatus Acetothermia bacterium]|nr:NAD-dependent epimerase/dehydratase family protein [Candidatus Acetothermia bacterium]MBI3642741.1 NAD-dependent epimerase/dehydratase family protein [Candidatus Acetothermia bacterium]
MTRAFVTGGTGLVGSHLVERLIERGDSVCALCRPSSDFSYIERLGADVIVGDLSDEALLRRAVQNMQIIYHCAARPPLGGTLYEFTRDNVDGTENLLKAALHQEIERFVHVSTVDVYGYSHHDGTNEEAPLKPDGPYSRSKIEAERIVLFFYERHQLPVTILRPCLICGPFDRHLFPAVIKILSLKRSPLVNGGRRLHDLVYARDVAEAMVLAATKPAAIGQCYNISGGVRKSAREILQAISDMAGKGSQFLHIPYLPAYGAARLIDFASKVIPYPVPSFCRWETIKAMGHDRHFDISKAVRELGYQPRVTLEEGIQYSWDWYCGKKPQAVPLWGL